MRPHPGTPAVRNQDGESAMSSAQKENTVEFREFQKIPRLNRPVIVTEKIDGTNGAVVWERAEPSLSGAVDDGVIASRVLDVGAGQTGAYNLRAQSRSRFITPKEDNHGFAAWVRDNADNLMELGPGYHYGEWWGCGIQRKYGQVNKRFSLFNVSRWRESRPGCCDVVPVILQGMGFQTAYAALEMLRANGSYAAPGFMQPEGIVAFHTQGNLLFKMTLLKDEEWKGKAASHDH